MANEWVPIELYGANNDGGKRRVTIADGASVSIGSLLQLLDPRTASYSHLAKVFIAGVAAEEHIANKGVTEISVWTDGIFDVVASGAFNVGEYVLASLQDNKVQALQPEDVASAAGVLQATLGKLNMKAFETATTGEVVNIRLFL